MASVNDGMNCLKKSYNEHYFEIFRKFDKGSEEKINQSQLRSFLAELGYDAIDPFYEGIIERFERKDKYTFEQTLSLLNELSEEQNVCERCKKAFKYLDYTDSGLIQMYDVRSLFFHMTKTAVIQRKEKVLTLIKLQKSENIDITEFLSIIKHLFKSNANPELLLLNSVLGQFAFDAMDISSTGQVAAVHVKASLVYAMWRKGDQDEKKLYRWNLRHLITFGDFYEIVKRLKKSQSLIKK